jgi:hypothetical protein
VKNCESDDDDAFRREMRQTFFGPARIEELEARNNLQKTRLNGLITHVANIRGEWIKESKRAEAEKKRADEAEAALVLGDSEELLVARQQILKLIEERDDALRSRDEMMKEKEKTEFDTKCMRGAVNTTRKFNGKLATNLSEAQNESMDYGEAELIDFHTMFATRNAKIDQPGDKVEQLIAEKFATNETLNKLDEDINEDSGDLNFYKSQNENLKYDVEELRSKLVQTELGIGR